MAVEVYSLTYADVLPKLPYSGEGITASSRPVTLSDVTTYIEAGASEITGVLARQGVAAADLSDDDLRQVQEAIVLYAAREVLRVFPFARARFESLDAEYKEKRDRLEADSSRISGSRASRVLSTVDTTVSERPQRFGGKGYKF
jgi:hypothetical protein